MKHIVLIVGALFLSILSVCAPEIMQDSLQLNDTILVEDSIIVTMLIDEMEHATIYQDSNIHRLMLDKILGQERGEKKVSGFRVQVYSSNQQKIAKNEALMLQQQLESQLTQPVYALLEPPFWKVRIGNFFSREEASAYIEELYKQFPELQSSTYIVPDKIVITQ